MPFCLEAFSKGCGTAFRECRRCLAASQRAERHVQFLSFAGSPYCPEDSPVVERAVRAEDRVAESGAILVFGPLCLAMISFLCL